jgi:polysaccharide deacetylase 2 family uncharacterized protein YibQ
MVGREGRRKLPRRQKQSSFTNVARLLILPVGGLLVFLAWHFVRAALPARPKPVAPRVQAALIRRPALPPAAVAPAPPVKHKGDIVLILDDVGFDHQPLTAAMAIDPNINFSVLPNAQHGVAFARQLHGRGFEVLCHLPMEPEGFPGVSPGDGAVLTSMSNDEIARATATNISSVPYARGVNNHMGSRATADQRVMRTVLASLPHGMYFIDSRTSGASVGLAVAREMRVPTAARNVFLDDVQNTDAIRIEIDRLRRTAEDRGIAIGIGHMYPVTIRALASAAPQLRRDGFRFIRASEAVR